MSTTLQDLVNRAVFFSTEMQTHFGALIADAEWEVDFTSDPHLTFTSSDGTVLRGRPHLLGSESSGQSTWLWGWDNINEFPESVVGLAHDVRKFGAAEDIAELVTAELELDEELALRLTLASKEATGKWAHYPAAAGAGTTVWLLVDAPELTLPEPRVKTTVRALMQGLTQTTVTDHRGALETYVDKRNIPTAEMSGGGLRLLFADGAADLSFDEQRRISNCEIGAPLEGEAAEQYAQATGTAPGKMTAADTAAPASEAGERTPAPAPSPSAESAGAAQRRGEDDTAVGVGATASASTEPTPADATADQSEAMTSPPSTAEVAPSDDGVQGSVRPRSESGSEEQPVEEREVDTAAEDESQDSGRTPGATEDRSEEPKKKKGLFSKLFGR